MVFYWWSHSGTMQAISPTVCIRDSDKLNLVKIGKLGKTWLKLWLDFRLEPILTITLEKFRSLQKWSKVTQK